jgi:hypothetical protein
VGSLIGCRCISNRITFLLINILHNTLEDNITFYVDSGAGQSMCSCSEVFHTLRACAVLVVGVVGSMPVHGMGTACFVVDVCGKESMLIVHN